MYDCVVVLASLCILSRKFILQQYSLFVALNRWIKLLNKHFNSMSSRMSATAVLTVTDERHEIYLQYCQLCYAVQLTFV